MSPAAHLLRALVRGYQLTLSSFLGRECRFLPTCSDYAREAIAVHGAVRGVPLALRRLVRCHPFAAPGYDPVPPARPAAASHPSSDRTPTVCTPSVCTSEHPCGTRRI